MLCLSAQLRQPIWTHASFSLPQRGSCKPSAWLVPVGLSRGVWSHWVTLQQPSLILNLTTASLWLDGLSSTIVKWLCRQTNKTQGHASTHVQTAEGHVLFDCAQDACCNSRWCWSACCGWPGFVGCSRGGVKSSYSWLVQHLIQLVDSLTLLSDVRTEKV